jgi:hypothetical protein
MTKALFGAPSLFLQIQIGLTAVGMAFAAHAAAQVTLYEREDYRGRAFSAAGEVDNLRRQGFGDRASSVVVSGGRWEACQDARYGGNCLILRPGQYPSLAAMGMNDRLSSAGAVEHDASVDDRRYAPLPLVSRDYGRRDEERLYQANITAVRAAYWDVTYTVRGQTYRVQMARAPGRTVTVNEQGEPRG